MVAGKMIPQLRTLTVLTENPVPVWSLTTIIHSSSFREISHSLLPPQAFHLHGAGTYVHAGKITYTTNENKFLKKVKNTVNTLLNVKLSETENGKHISILENGKHISILDLPGDILIIPQATLGGRVKGRNMQYHSNSGKEEGLELYSQFVCLCEKELAANSKCAEAGVAVEHGTYGNRQILRLDTNGPYTPY